MLVGTPCTPDGSGGCQPRSGAQFGGALWALDAASGAMLNNGKPVLLTGDHIRAPAAVDGEWVFVQDDGADLYGLTIDPNVQGDLEPPRAARAPPEVAFCSARRVDRG